MPLTDLLTVRFCEGATSAWFCSRVASAFKDRKHCIGRFWILADLLQGVSYELGPNRGGFCKFNRGLAIMRANGKLLRQRTVEFAAFADNDLSDPYS